MFLVESQHLPLKRGRSRSRVFGSLRQGLFHFRQVLYAITRQCDMLPSRRYASDDVVACPSKGPFIGGKGLLLPLKVAVPNVQWPRRRIIRAPGSTCSAQTETPSAPNCPVEILARGIRATDAALGGTCSFGAAFRALGLSKKKIQESHVLLHQAFGPSIQGDDRRKRTIRFSDHRSSIPPSTGSHPPSRAVAGCCFWERRKLFRRRTGTAWQPSP